MAFHVFPQPTFSFKDCITIGNCARVSLALGIAMSIKTTCHAKLVLESFEAHRTLKVFRVQVTFSVKTPRRISFELGWAHVTLVRLVITMHLGNVTLHIVLVMKFLVTLRARKVS